MSWAVFRRLERAVWRLKDRLNIPARDERETAARLEWLAKRKPRYTPGTFPFRFGRIQYVDSLSLQGQFLEIFVKGLYDFSVDKSNPLIIDCGGNIGMSVIRFKRQYPQSRLIVFEPDPKICDVLNANIESLALTGVEVIPAAAWTIEGQTRFQSDGGDGGRIDARGEERIATVRLAATISDEVDLLKLDIEGAEWAVLQDLCETEKIGKVKRLICEFHGGLREHQELGGLLNSLARRGFSFTFPWAFCHPGLPGVPESTPFRYAPDGKFILLLYAWQP